MTIHHKAVAQGLLALSLSLAAPALLADDDDCDVPVKQWQSRDAVLRLAAQQGWQVQRLKIDDGCYEIRGRDAQGRAFKARLDPQTLRVVKMKLRAGDDEHDRDHRHRHERERSQDRDASEPAGSVPRPGTPSPGHTP